MFEWLRWVDDIFSTYKVDSEISRLARGEVDIGDCAPEVALVLDLCHEVGRSSGGYFDAWATGALDPSGLVKGWSVERASEMLAEAGSANHCINAGGDVRVRGSPESGRLWNVGIVHPFDRGALTIVVVGSDIAVATSGTAERGDHVYDPHTREPVADLVSVTLVGPELTFTDAFATAALAMGTKAIDWLPALPEHDAYVVDATGHAWWTAGMSAYAPALDDAAGPAPIVP
jgi:thiamine biosynthesis lipoprotein